MRRRPAAEEEARMSAKAEMKQRSHDLILASAAALLRGRGIRDSSVADVMKRAGLTVGGFYGHFDSKEHLFTEALRYAAGTWRKLLARATGDSPRARALSIVDRYLSPRHRDEAEGGCPLPAAVAEVTQTGEPYRSTLASELGSFVAALGGLLDGAAGPGGEPGGGDAGPAGESAPAAARAQALGLIALMYGALSLSRALQGTPLSDDVLEAARQLAATALSNPEVPS
jgi:TetR/AcrR family transcriptional regulator, transcriptional repressor for nem operon